MIIIFISFNYIFFNVSYKFPLLISLKKYLRNYYINSNNIYSHVLYLFNCFLKNAK